MKNKKGLHNRHKSEIAFHDVKACKTDKGSFYNQGATEEAYNKMMRIAGNIAGKMVLDFGCGTGWTSIQYAKRGASVLGLDISMGSLQKARALVSKKGLQDKICLVQGSCEQLPFRNSFDLIIGVAILHHLDLSFIVNSLKSGLKDNGICLFMEPLDHNPMINFYRLLTPNRRTRDEKPLSIDVINELNNDFSSVKMHGYHFLSLFSFVFFFFKAHKLFRRVNKFLSSIDDAVFEVFPKLQRYCWGAIIELRK